MRAKSHWSFQNFRYAWDGLVTLVQTQTSARIHAGATGLAALAGLLLKLDAQAWGLLVVAMALIWIAEAANTALEFLADRVSTEFHPLIKQSKDVAAAAVLVAAIASGLIGLLVLGPPLWERISLLMAAPIP